MATVLLVEDEAPVLEPLRYALERAGYTVLSANSGESALRICRHHTGTIDVLVSDVFMQPVSGFEVAAQIKAANPNTVVILMSGSPRSTFPDACPTISVTNLFARTTCSLLSLDTPWHELR